VEAEAEAIGVEAEAFDKIAASTSLTCTSLSVVKPAIKIPPSVS